MTGNYFVELARLIFLFRFGLAKLQCCAIGAQAGSPVEASHFFLERCGGKCVVELARLIVLFHVGLAQFFVGVALSE